MSETPDAWQLPDPIIERRRGISLIWLIPLVAAAVGGWLGYRTLSEQGPTVSIEFREGAGLEAGKTPVKFKAVNVGLVTDVTLSDDLQTVQVDVDFDKKMASYLLQDTRFWIVRPRIGLTGVSGLGTLVSGAYIEMEPGTGKPRERFKGLERPPIVGATEAGRRFVLESEDLGSLTAGSPLYFRSIPVGQVLGYDLSNARDGVQVHVFVKAPYDTLVTPDSRFWNISGVELAVDADGVNLHLGSVQSLITGGISFDSPASTGLKSMPSEPGSIFHLHESARAIDDVKSMQPLVYALYFEGSVRGLTRDAPVEFRGIKIGLVREIKLELNSQDFSMRIPVIIEIDPNRISTLGVLGDAGPKKTIEELVARGLRARLQTGSFLTGQLFIDTKLYDNVPHAAVGHDGTYTVIPTIPSTLEKFERSAQDMLAQLRDLPLEELIGEVVSAARGANQFMNSPELLGAVKEMQATLKQYRSLAGSLDQEVSPLARSLTTTADAARRALSLSEPGSDLRYDLSSTLKELTAAARSIRILAEYLERNPQALVSGRK